MKSKYISAFKKGIKPDPYVDYVEWGNKHFRLTKESSVEPGQYRTSRTPWVEEILRELSPQSPTQTVVVIKPTQMAFTTLANVMLCCIAHRYPGPCMFAQPTDDMVKKHSKKKLAPTILAIPALKGIIKPVKSRDAGNTLLLKEFPGGSWTLTGSNSPTSARSDSIRYLILDDYDGFVQDAGGEGAPGDLMKKRTDAFGGKKKIYINSTPTIKGTSHIEKEWEESSQGFFNVPCPECGEFQFLKFGGVDADYGIKFTRDKDNQVVDVWYICQYCHQKIDEWQKTNMLIKGKYIHKYPERKTRGFKVNSQYSPLGWVPWSQIVEEFLKSVKDLKRGDSRAMKAWVTTRQAEPWEEDGDRPEWEGLSTRADPYKLLTVPWGGMVLVGGVDVQDDRLEVVVLAYGRGEECWVVYYGTLYGNPDQQQVWGELDELISMSYEHESGASLHISCMGIDSGHKTQTVYKYCRTRKHKTFAVKGIGTIGVPVLPIIAQKKRKAVLLGFKPYNVGTDTAKALIYDRLKFKSPGPGYYHFPIGLPDEFYLQLTAEKKQTVYNKDGFASHKWKKIRARNDVLDCFVYAYAAAIKVGVDRKNWSKLEKYYKNINSDEKPEPKKNESYTQQVIKKRKNKIKRSHKKTGFVNSWR